MSNRHFTLHELIRSDKANELGIVNVPNFAQVSMLALFVDMCLEHIREAAGRPVIVNSGYRCKKLNEAINGSKGSHHMMGDGYCAADITLGDPALNRALFSVLEKSDIPINEWILGKDARYIHVSWHPWKRKREVIRL